MSTLVFIQRSGLFGWPDEDKHRKVSLGTWHGQAGMEGCKSVAGETIWHLWRLLCRPMP
jgi:hypothetical protein